jgi:hypothetical protein
MMDNLSLELFVAEWGFCPHPEQLLETNTRLCFTCENDPSQRSFSQEQAATLTHQTQVAIFGWCACEGNESPYKDCPS